MKEVEYFTFMMPPSIWCKKPHPSSFKMTLEAAKRYPDAKPILSSREVRQVGSEVITADAPYQRRTRSKTAGEEKLSAWLVSRIGETSTPVQPAPDPAAPRDNEPPETEKPPSANAGGGIEQQR